MHRIWRDYQGGGGVFKIDPMMANEPDYMFHTKPITYGIADMGIHLANFSTSSRQSLMLTKRHSTERKIST